MSITSEPMTWLGLGLVWLRLMGVGLGLGDRLCDCDWG